MKFPPFDIYAALGVSADATAGQIKAAHRQLVRLYHPDRDSAPASHERFLQVQRAYEVLSNPSSRAKYDRHLSEARGERSSATEESQRTPSDTVGARPTESGVRETTARPTPPSQGPVRPSTGGRSTYPKKPAERDIYDIREESNATRSRTTAAEHWRDRSETRTGSTATLQRPIPAYSDVDFAKDIALRSAACIGVLSALTAAIVCFVNGFFLIALIAAPAIFILLFLVSLALTYPFARVVLDAIQVGRWLSIRILRKRSTDASRPAIFLTATTRTWMFVGWFVFCMATLFAILSALGSIDDRRLEEREMLAPLVTLTLFAFVPGLYAGIVWLCIGLRQSLQEFDGESADDEDIAMEQLPSRRKTRHSRAVALNT